MKTPSWQETEKIGFYNIFCKDKTKFFGGWYLECDEKEINDFFKKNEKERENFMRLYLYLESAEILKKQSKQELWSVANIYSKQLWYHIVLLLLIGIAGKISENERKINEKSKEVSLGINERFERVMNKLEEKEQHELFSTYFANKKKFSSFKEAVEHIYQSRTFFAHEFDKIDENTPSDSSLSFSTEKIKPYLIHPNLPHGKLFLYIIISILRYLGYTKLIKITTSKKFKEISDFLSDEA